jgi:hypothetical protein
LPAAQVDSSNSGRAKVSIQQPLNAGCRNRGRMLAEFKKRVKADFYMPARCRFLAQLQWNDTK